LQFAARVSPIGSYGQLR
jgi:hypothetical protein